MNVSKLAVKILETLDASSAMAGRKVKRGCKTDVEEVMVDLTRLVANLSQYRVTYAAYPDLIANKEAGVYQALESIRGMTVSVTDTVESRAKAMFDSQYNDVGGITADNIIELMAQFARSER
ncbi:hypothetical protein VPHK397_0121 [Vibrio phage K397]